MADITTPATIRWSNEQVRVLATKLADTYNLAREVQDYYYAHPELSAELTANMDGTLLDGAETDGRSLITGNAVLNLITRASELTADYEASSNAKLNTVLAIAV